MTGKSDRLHSFAGPAGGHSLVVDASAGLSLGPLPGLEDFPSAVAPLLPLLDGLVVSPGQARKLANRASADAALLVRADWTNALRPADFVLPPETIAHIPLVGPQDALQLGGSGMVLHFLLGYEEQIEAGCLRSAVQLALAGTEAGLPLVVDVQPTGPRVVLYRKAVELGVSYALESGADGVAVPWPGAESFETVLKMAAGTPVWVKPFDLDIGGDDLARALDLGARGLWLDARVFAAPNPPGLVGEYADRLHAPARDGGEG